MTVSVLQSNYIPWKGYFDLISASDVFIVYDDVQFTKNDWRNRNLIKTKDGPKWLTIPVKQVSLSQRICETMVSDVNWGRKHWQTLYHSYSKAAAFQEMAPIFQRLFMTIVSKNLSEINVTFITEITKLLDIRTTTLDSRSYVTSGNRNERLIQLLKGVGCRRYLSGPSAKAYIDLRLFHQHGIEIEWMNYEGYPEYPQLHPPFHHNVSILDLLFNAGDRAKKYLKYGN